MPFSYLRDPQSDTLSATFVSLEDDYSQSIPARQSACLLQNRMPDSLDKTHRRFGPSSVL